MRPTTLSLSLIVLLLSACVQKEPDMATLKRTADAFNNASIQSMMTGSYDSVLTYYADDGVWFAPNMPMIKGKDSIRAMIMTPGAPRMTTGSFNVMDLKAAGTIAYETGTYDMAFEVPNVGPMKDVGKYVRIWHEQQNGSWKVYNETWNSDLPAAPMPEPKKDKKTGKK